jgi:3-oxoacyl-ACP reductase-like protein
MLKALSQRDFQSVSNDQGHPSAPSAGQALGDLPDSQAFWHNRRVLVTGGNGFLGKYVVQKLRERGADVFVADKERYDLRHLEDTPSGCALGDRWIQQPLLDAGGLYG